ncbi:MAG TPA: hypothetical protein VHA15_06975 [Burkholderiales bacterium]|nr:hypothetical protein [Burkholderiales bacterium]
MKTDARRRLASWSLAGALVFAQMIGIAQVCASDTTPAMAFSNEEMPPGCTDGSPAVAGNPNACLQHCNGGDQTSATPVAVVAGPPAVAVLAVRMPVEGIPLPLRNLACESHSPDPPPSIRFCSYQL